MNERALTFHLGKAASAIPLVFFIIWAITICVLGAPSENGLILGAVIGLTLGMFLCKDPWSRYADQVFTGMANRIAAVTIVAWFWAGMFAQVLRQGGLVDGLVWLGGASDATGGIFVGITFVLAAIFASAVGTGYGTTVAFSTLMYPAGLIMGADPVWLFAAILSGAAFGDNLAPVSDTTVVSATTQETDIPGVVRTRFKYAIMAAIPALAAFTIFGGGDGSFDAAAAERIIGCHGCAHCRLDAHRRRVCGARRDGDLEHRLLAQRLHHHQHGRRDRRSAGRLESWQALQAAPLSPGEHARRRYLGFGLHLSLGWWCSDRLRNHTWAGW